MADTDATASERACFEAGIKFGALYHQFAGTPVSERSARSLERAMAEAIENQPACEAVEVAVDDAAVAAASTAGYAELTGRLMEVTLAVAHEGVGVEARMATEDGYPRMRVERVER
jgi:hypothetical protein